MDCESAYSDGMFGTSLSALTALSIAETINNVANCLRICMTHTITNNKNNQKKNIYERSTKSMHWKHVLSCIYVYYNFFSVECMRHGTDNAVACFVVVFFFLLFLHSVEMICVISSHAYPLKTPTNMIIPWFVFSILPLIFLYFAAFYVLTLSHSLFGQFKKATNLSRY